MKKSTLLPLPTLLKYVTGSIIALALLAAVPMTNAAIVSMTAGDGFGSSSFNSAGNWDNAAAPSAGNDYFNATYLLRTPADTGSHTFAGDSLTITGAGLATGANNEALMWKGSGTTAIITVNDLTIDGGQLRHGQGDADTFTMAGNITVGNSGANFATQGGMIITANIAGFSTVRVLDSGSSDGRRLVTLASGANTYTGDYQLYGNDDFRARLRLANGANMDFVIGASGVNNSIFGTGTAYLDGDFFFDLSGASKTVGDSWLVEGVSRVFYGETFTVNGFTSISGTQWSMPTGIGTDIYLFDESTGILSVSLIPEPSTAALLLGGFGLLLGYQRTRKS